MKNVNELLDRMISLYGFEHDAVIMFATLIDKGFDYETLRPIVVAHEKYPLDEEEE